jgi:GNAT superfamily N-acetyltransferase
MRLKTRLATVTDIPVLCDLLAMLFAQEAEFAPDRAKQEAGLRLILADPAIGEILVGELDGQIVGMASLLYIVSTFLGQRVALLEDMVVDPEHRGCGTGEAILGAATRHARERGCGRLTLLTDSTNAGAIRFYERLGFARSPMIPFRRSIDP